MSRRHRVFLPTVVLAAVMATGLAQERFGASAPVLNYAVSFFSDAGYHRLRVEGASAEVGDPRAIRIEGMRLTVFTGDEHRAVESVLMAPVAIVDPETERVHGPASARLIHGDIEVTGENWTYDHRKREVHVARAARIIFQADLPALLQ